MGSLHLACTKDTNNIIILHNLTTRLKVRTIFFEASLHDDMMVSARKGKIGFSANSIRWEGKNEIARKDKTRQEYT